MTILKRFFSLALLGIGVSCLTGCGGDDELPRGPVEGHVTLNGKPLSGVTIVFANKEAGVSQMATLDDDGHYEFTTYNSEGLPAGHYDVSISSRTIVKPGEEFVTIGAAPTKSTPKTTAIPDRYENPETSGLNADVNAGENPPFDFDLKD